MTTIPLDLEIERFLKAADNAAQATEDGQRFATRSFLIKRATALRARRAAIRERLDTGCAWLTENPDDPDYATNEDRLIAWTAEYEQVCDALNEGLARWLGTKRNDPRQEAA